jgi:ketosteroid isomerase-like protein
MPAPTTTTTELVHRLFAANDSRDVDAVAAMLTEDVALRFGNAPVVTGRSAVRQASVDFNAMVASVSHEITDLFELSERDVVVVELLVTYKRLDGEQLTLPCCNVFRLRDGLISDYRIYMDVNPAVA